MLLNFIFGNKYTARLKVTLNKQGISNYIIQRQLVDLGPCMPCDPLTQKVYKILDAKNKSLIGWVKMGTRFWGLAGNEMRIYLPNATIPEKPLSPNSVA